MITGAHTAEGHKGHAAEASHKRKREVNFDADRGVERKYGLDMDILECPICLEPFSPPVYQCHNGHTACSSCCKLLTGKKCPTCSRPTGSIRCMAIEKILESLHVSCKYARYGCNVMERPTDIEDHETYCDYEPFWCPAADCVFEGSSVTLPAHLSEAHHVRTISHNNVAPAWFTMEPFDQFVLVKVDHAANGGETYPLYLLHHVSHELLGDVFFCTCFGGYDNEYYYLKVKHESVCPVPHSMDDATAKDLRHVGEYWNEDFLLLPSKRNTPANNLSFEVHFRVTDRFDNE